jgi:hypothetical protein
MVHLGVPSTQRSGPRRRWFGGDPSNEDKKKKYLPKIWTVNSIKQFYYSTMEEEHKSRSGMPQNKKNSASIEAETQARAQPN